MKLKTYYNPAAKIVLIQMAADAAPAAPFTPLGDIIHEPDDNASGMDRTWVSHVIFQHVQERLYLLHKEQNMQSVTLVPAGTYKPVDRFWVDVDKSSANPGETIKVTPHVGPADASHDGFYCIPHNEDLVTITAGVGFFNVVFKGEGETILKVGIKNTDQQLEVPVETIRFRRPG